MKVKKFDNLWTMGLILCVGILVVFYIAKIFFPQWIIGVAQIPRIVDFGNFVDSNKWLRHLVNILYGMLTIFFYCGACCRKKTLNKMSVLCITIANILLVLVTEFFAVHYTTINYLVFVVLPFVVCICERNVTKDTFTSTIVCFGIDITSQLLSLCIRNIVLLATSLNTATITILLIDTFIWRMLLYLFFNNKNKKEEC